MAKLINFGIASDSNGVINYLKIIFKSEIKLFRFKKPFQPIIEYFANSITVYSKKNLNG